MSPLQGFLTDGDEERRDVSEAKRWLVVASRQAVDSLIESLRRWALNQPDIRGIALVGSFARGNFHAESDVDFVIITSAKDKIIQLICEDFVFDRSIGFQIEEWVILTSLRVYYDGSLEVEYGLVSDEWVHEPLDAGTKEVVLNGFKVVLDKDNIFGAVTRFIDRNR
ncbi:nucleotidyltransferase domain-containing protein [Alicyclobacillus curvatus]|nr:nucleotidyltransferase domain-containing protein [Alicyclobacillus curvatus]